MNRVAIAHAVPREKMAETPKRTRKHVARVLACVVLMKTKTARHSATKSILCPGQGKRRNVSWK